MSIKKKILCVIAALAALAVIAAALIAGYAKAIYCVADFTPADFAVTDAQLDNPYQGWYSIFGFVISDDTADDALDEKLARCIDGYECELALLEINLREYAGGDISESGLSQISHIFSAWRDAGCQLIVRFLYDWNGEAMQLEPDDISIVLRHMEQVSAPVNEYADCVYILQGIFVGNNGEMNNSHYMSEDDMVTLVQKWAKVTDPSIFLSVRTPAHWRIISRSFEPLSENQAFDGSVPARTGLFNDGMFGSAFDLGTYGPDSLADAADYTAHGTREEEIAFQNALCLYVPNGGEAVMWEGDYSEFENAVADLSSMRVSYLNQDYSAAVLKQWQTSTYEGDDIFNGMSGYDYVSAHMGYRFALADASLEFDCWHDTDATLSITISNTGFSSCYRPLDVTLTLVSDDTDEAISYTLDEDSRFWQPDEPSTLSAALDVRDAEDGGYDVYLSVTDPALDCTILFANEEKNTKYGYLVGHMDVIE